MLQLDASPDSTWTGKAPVRLTVRSGVCSCGTIVCSNVLHPTVKKRKNTHPARTFYNWGPQTALISAHSRSRLIRETRQLTGDSQKQRNMRDHDHNHEYYPICVQEHSSRESFGSSRRSEKLVCKVYETVHGLPMVVKISVGGHNSCESWRQMPQ